jgi:very-short-patch-repair endonuclease
MSKQPVVPKELSPGEEAFYLHCRIEGLAAIREFQFCERKWRFDFFFAEGIAVEIEGFGRHQRGGFETDMEKYNRAALMGFKVLRFTTAQAKSGEAIATVLEALGRKPRGIDD